MFDYVQLIQLPYMMAGFETNLYWSLGQGVDFLEYFSASGRPVNKITHFSTAAHFRWGNVLRDVVLTDQGEALG